MFCADCGVEAPHTIQGSCPKCFVKHTPLLDAPDVADVEFCAHCGARRVGKHWQDVEEGAPMEWLREDALREQVGVHMRVEEPLLQFDEAPQDDKHFRVHIVLEGHVEGVPVRDEGESLVRQRRGVCDRCSRMQGNYFAAIIQLRATERPVTDAELERSHQLVATELSRLIETGNRFAFLTKEGPIHHGWDYYIGDIEAARQVCRILKARLGATVQETAKLVGRREGEDVYRVTFLVRIRLFATDDFAVGPGKRIYQVTGLSHGRAACIDLLTHLKTRVPEPKLKRLGGPEIVQEAVLVSASGDELQVLDPVSLNTQDVPAPETYEPTGETVPVIRHEERLYLVPGFKQAFSTSALPEQD